MMAFCDNNQNYGILPVLQRHILGSLLPFHTYPCGQGNKTHNKCDHFIIFGIFRESRKALSASKVRSEFLRRAVLFMYEK